MKQQAPQQKKASTKASPDAGLTLASNRKASHEYEILDRYEAGIVLSGTEIKSIRAGKADIGDAEFKVRYNPPATALMVQQHILTGIRYALGLIKADDAIGTR